MKLSDYEISQLKDLNAQMKQAVRELDNNLNSFDANVSCLRKYERITRSFLKLNEPYVENHLQQGEKLLKNKWNVFQRLKVKNEQSKFKEISEEINALFFDEELKQLMLVVFLGKPVSSLRVDVHESTSTSQLNSFFRQLQETHTVTYKITFQDKTFVTWHSLEDEKQMDQARRTFIQKVPQPTPHAPVRAPIPVRVEEQEVINQPVESETTASNWWCSVM